jgi:hypothetical protein
MRSIRMGIRVYLYFSGTQCWRNLLPSKDSLPLRNVTDEQVLTHPVAHQRVDSARFQRRNMEFETYRGSDTPKPDSDQELRSVMAWRYLAQFPILIFKIERMATLRIMN